MAETGFHSGASGGVTSPEIGWGSERSIRARSHSATEFGCQPPFRAGQAPGRLKDTLVRLAVRSGDQ